MRIRCQGERDRLVKSETAAIYGELSTTTVYDPTY